MGATVATAPSESAATPLTANLPVSGDSEVPEPLIKSRRAARLPPRRSPVSRALTNRAEVASTELRRTEQRRSRALQRVFGQAERRSRALQRDVEQAERRRRARQRELEQADRRREARVEAGWVTPVERYRITARFGDSSYLWSARHTGVDLAAPTGTRVDAVAGGVVGSAGYEGSYGNKVVIRHEDGTETWYAHLDSIDAVAGQAVAGGDRIGTVGSTGNVTGPHLHLEVRPDGLDPVDPLPVLAERGVVVQ